MAEAPTKENFDAESLSREEKQDLLGDSRHDDVSSSRDEETPKAEPAEPESENKSESTPDPEETTPEEGKKKPDEEAEPERFRLKGKEFDQERKFIALRKQGIDRETALKAVYGESIKKDSGEKAEPEKSPTAEIDGEIETAKSEIADLEKKIEEASEELDTAEALKLQREIGKRERTIDKLEAKKDNLREKQKTQELTSFQQKEKSNAQAAMKEFPDLQDKESEARQEFDEWVEVKESDPDYQSIFQSPRWPLTLAREFAHEKGLQTATQKEAEIQSKEKPVTTETKENKPANESAPRAAATSSGRAAKVLTGGETPGGESTEAEATKDGLERALPNMSSKDKFDLLGAS